MNKTANTPVRTRAAWWAAAGLVLFLAAYLRFTRLGVSPGWHSDEGSLLILAHSINSGGWNYLGLSGSIQLMGWQPLFAWLLAPLLRLAGNDILVLRMLTASLGVAVTFAMLILPAKMRLPDAKALGVLAAGVYALLPYTVLHNRIGFSYNLIALLVILIIWALYRYYEDGSVSKLAAASFLAGVGFLSNFWMAAVFPVCILVPLFRKRRDVPAARVRRVRF